MIDSYIDLAPYALGKAEKAAMLKEELLRLTQHHYECCREYRNILNAMNYCSEAVHSYTDIPFLPVRMFKLLDLLSIDRSDVFKTMMSSSTTGQSPSKIYVDRANAMLQQKIMLKILGDYVGKKRLSVLIVDSPAILKDRTQFTARGAAIVGLQMLSTEMTYALREDMSLDEEVTRDFLLRNAGKPFIVFGFTFMLWQHLYQYALARGIQLDFSGAHLLSSGGWKKLQSQAISKEAFKQCFTEQFGITSFVDHYGMVEQTGCIYAECEHGHLHASIFSEVIIRNPGDFSVCNMGEKGIIQVVSLLPHAYPGHSLLTEDEGIILGEDDCPCGRLGKYIEISGRLESAELRGCSDTYADKV